MKNFLILLLSLLFVSSTCFADEQEKLPEIPWKMIAETQAHLHSNLPWKADIKVKLFGNYNVEDSIATCKAISTLNELVETITIEMSTFDRGNLEILFLDSTNSEAYNHIIELGSRNSSWMTSSYGASPKSPLATIAVNLRNIEEDKHLNFITNTLAFVLYNNYWHDEDYLAKRHNNEKVNESIFRSYVEDTKPLFFEEMHAFDKELLRTVYSDDFYKKLPLAKKQFASRFPTWLRKKPLEILGFPAIVIIFLFILGYNKLLKKVIPKIPLKILRFNAHLLIIALFCIPFLSYFFLLCHYWEFGYIGSGQLVKNLTAGSFVTFAILIPTINILRFIELLIYRTSKRKTQRTLLIFLSTGILPFISLFLLIFFNTDKRLDSSEIKAFSIVFIVLMTIAAFRALISYFFMKEKELVFANEAKLSNLRELKTKAELNALHSRINPHFLYNSLNSIAGLAHDDATKTEHMALSLSKLFKYSINKEKSDWTTIQEEMEMVQIYLDVEKVRFDERLKYSLHYSKELEDLKIPRFIIQPLVENAVKHGTSKSTKNGEIAVSVTHQDKTISITVSDNGSSFPKDIEPGFGIQSIYDKLEILYPEKFELSFINEPQKQVLIHLKQMN